MGRLRTIDYLTEIGEGKMEGELLRRLEEKLKAHCKRENLFLFPDALPLKKLPENFYPL